MQIPTGECVLWILLKKPQQIQKPEAQQPAVRKAKPSPSLPLSLGVCRSTGLVTGLATQLPQPAAGSEVSLALQSRHREEGGEGW